MKISDFRKLKKMTNYVMSSLYYVVSKIIPLRRRDSQTDGKDFLVKIPFERINARILMDLLSEALIQSNFHLEDAEEIKQDAYSKLFRGKFQQQNKDPHPIDVLIKKSNEVFNNKTAATKFLLNEALILKELEHEAIISLIGVVLDENSLSIVLKNCSHGILLDYIRSKDNMLSVKKSLMFALDVANGMKYLNSEKYIHCNLKAESCWIDENFHVKICDFTKSRTLTKNDDYMFRIDGSLPIRWTALEYLENQKFSLKSDVWSFGVLLWECMTRGCEPYPKHEDEEIKDYLKSGGRLFIPEKCPVDIYNDLMINCWQEDCRQRISFEKIISIIKNKISQDSLELNKLINSHFYVNDPREKTHIDERSSISSDRKVSISIKLNESTDEPFNMDETVKSLIKNDLFINESSVVVDVDINKRLGEGCYGICYSGKMKKANGLSIDVAIKTLRKNLIKRDQTNEAYKSLIDEALRMKEFQHKNVIRLFGVGVVEKDSLPMIVLEYMKNGSLLEYIQSNEKYPTLQQLLYFAIDIANGMAYLSSKKFVHRDLAARNCLLSDDWTVKISDFGLSREIYEKNYYKRKSDCPLPIRWMSPESLEKNRSTVLSDVWSYGIVIWELMTRGHVPYSMGSIPYEDLRKPILELIKNGKRLKKPKECPIVIYMIMLDCWHLKCRLRPSFVVLSERIKNFIETKPNELDEYVSSLTFFDSDYNDSWVQNYYSQFSYDRQLSVDERLI